MLRLDICRKIQNLVLITFLFSAIFLTACQENKPIQEIQNVDETSTEDYLAILEEMTELMNEAGDTTVQLEKVRAYVQNNIRRLKTTTNAIKNGIKDLDEKKRNELLAKTTPKVEDALERFASAQMSLRARMTESEQWELGEALAMLH